VETDVQVRSTIGHALAPPSSHQAADIRHRSPAQGDAD
jgi:hypothetical protein